MAKYAGVDLSKHNADVDYAKLAKAKIKGKTVKFAMLRLGYGCSKDVLFDRHYAGCKAANIHVGVYVWSRARNAAEARQEALWALEQIKGLDISYPIAMDFEDEEILGLKLSREQYTAIVRAFLSTIKNANYYPILYIGKYVLADNIDGNILNDYDIWLAQYTTEGRQAQLGQTMWQFGIAGHELWDYSKVGSVDGVTGPCDVNWAYVGYAAKIKKLGMNKPKIKYKVVGEKTVEAADLAKAQGQLKALGFSVTTEEI